MFERQLQPILDDGRVSVADRLRTVCESVAQEVVAAIPVSKKKLKLLATGGGALNVFLIRLLKEKLQNNVEVIVPPGQIIEFKEALVFAFLGVLRVRNQANVLSSVTRAGKNSSGGAIVGL
jgi:anhydro-N-acetylmuramic acid kinase